MSASTITTSVRLGAATARALAERRGELRAQRFDQRRRSAAGHRRLLEGSGVRDAAPLADALGHCDALASLASEHDLSAIRSLAASGRTDEARERLEHLERDAERSWTRKTAARLALEQIAASSNDLAAERGSLRFDANGSVSARFRDADGHSLAVSAPDAQRHGTAAPNGDDDPDAPELSIDWDVARAGIDSFRSADGEVHVGCEAEKAQIQDICDSAEGLEMKITSSEGGAAATEAEEPRQMEAGS